jgi:hypothetical protein
MSFAAAIGASVRATWSVTWRMSKAICCAASRPDSIRDRSRSC